MRRHPSLHHRFGCLVAAGLFLSGANPVWAEEDAQAAGSAAVDRAEQPDPIVERFFAVLKKNPRRGTALDRVWASYVDQGRLPELIERCRKETENSPEDPNGWIVLGLMESRRGKDALAIEAFEKAESLDASNPLPPYYRGTTLMVIGRLREAAAAFESAAEKKPGRSDFLRILHLMGRTYERLGDAEKAKEIWQRVEKAFPGDLDILEQIAQALEEEERLDEALARYKSLLGQAEEDYDRVRFALSAADLKVRLGRKSEAREDFEKLLDGLAPKSWLFTAVRDRIELIFTREADQAGMAKYYESWLEKHPRDIDAIRRLSGTLVRLGRADEGRKKLESAVDLAPSDVELRQSLIDLLIATKKYAEAQAQYAELNKIDPGNPDIIRDWGLVVLENKKLSEEARRKQAADTWETLLESRKDDPQSIVLVADLMAGAEMPARAEALYKRAVEAAPKEPRYREYLGFFYHSQKRKEEAIATLEGIAQGDRRSAETLSQLADLLSSMGYLEESLPPARQAAEAAPDVFRFAHGFVRLLLKAKEADEAAAWIEKTRELTETDDERAAILKNEIELLGLNGKLAETTETLETKLAEDPSKATALDWWRLANLQKALGDKKKTEEAIKKAVDADPDSLLIATAAAQIHEQLGKLKLAAEARRRLASIDAAGRTDHLKSLVRIQMRLGNAEEALQTAGQVMAGASGNTDNCRFYASVAQQAGKPELAVKALRRAAQVDPTDDGILSALASVLADTDELDQAIEIEWRVLDRTKDLRGKLSVVSRLSEFYLREGDQGELIKRFKQLAQNPERRREVAYCTAQAFLAVQDFQSARQSLETLMGETEAEADAMLLDQLSRISEAEGDFPAAIRYQEMLFEKTDAAHDRDRLASLYFAGGKVDEGEKLITKRILESDQPEAQTRAVCSLLAEDRFQAALDILTKLRKERPDDWVLLYHEGEALTRLSKFDEAAARFETLRALALADDTAAFPSNIPLPGSTTSRGGGMRSTMMALPFYKWAMTGETVRQTLLRDENNNNMPYSVAISSRGATRRKPQWTPTEYGEAWVASWMWDAFAADKQGTKETFIASIDKRLPADSDNVDVLKKRFRLEISLNEPFGRMGPEQETLTKVVRRLADTGEQDWRLCYLLLQSQRIQMWVMVKSTARQRGVSISLPFDGEDVKEPTEDELREMAGIVKQSLDTHPDLVMYSLGMLTQAMNMKGLDTESKELRSHFRDMIMADKAVQLPDSMIASFLAEDGDMQTALDLAEKHLEDAKPDRARVLLATLLNYHFQRKIPQDIQLPDLDGGMGMMGTTFVGGMPVAPPDETNEEDAKKKQKEQLLALEPTVRKLLGKIIECDAAAAAAGKKSNTRYQFHYGSSSQAVGLFQMLTQEDESIQRFVQQAARMFVDHETFELYQQVARYYYALAVFDKKPEERIVRPGKMPPGVGRLVKIIEEELSNRTDEGQRETIRRGLFCLRCVIGDKKAESLFKSLLESRKPDFQTTVIRAALKARKKDFDGALEALNAFQATKIATIHDRDRIVVELYNRSDRKESLKKRAIEAVGRLVSAQLTDEEMLQFVSTLHELGQKDEAEKLTARLIAAATDQNTLRQLMDQRSARGDHETAAKLALRLLRQTRRAGFASQNSGDYQDYIRREAMGALKRAGKLKELAEPIEEQLKQSPGSIDLMQQLIEIYVQLNRRADAKKLCEKLENILPTGDADNCRLLGKLYSSVGEKDKGYAWMSKALAKKPQLLMQDFHEFQRAAGNDGKMKEFIEMIVKLDDAILVQQYHSFNHNFDDWLGDKKTHDVALELFKKLWDAEGMDRGNLISSLNFHRSEVSKDLYPYLREGVLDSLRLPEEEKEQKGPSLLHARVVYPHGSIQSPHSVRMWSSDGVYSSSVTLMNALEAKKNFDEFRKEVEEILTQLETARGEAKEGKETPVMPEQLLTAKIHGTRVLLAMVEARSGNSEKAKKLARGLLDEKGNQDLLQESTLVLGQELAKQDACAEEAIECYIKALDGTQFTHNPEMKRYVTEPLGKLYKKAGKEEKLLELVVPQVKESARILALANGRDHFRLGNHYYHPYSLFQQIQTQVSQIEECGFRVQALQLMEHHLFGRQWFRDMMKPTNGPHYPMDELSSLRAKINDNISIEEIVASIDLLIPPFPEPKKAETKKEGPTDTDLDEVESDDEEPDATLLGAVISTKMKSEGSVDGIGSKLQEALRTIKKADPEKLAELRTRVNRFVKEQPDNPTVLAVSALGEVVWGDDVSRREAVRRCAKWVDSHKPEKKEDNRPNNGFSSQDPLARDQLAWWLVAKQAMDDKELTKECETLTVRAARFVPKQSAGGRSPSPPWYQRLLSSMARHAAPGAAKNASRDAFAAQCEAALFSDNGSIPGNLDRTIDAALHTLVNGIAAQQSEPVLQTLEKAYADGWPSPREGALSDRGKTELLRATRIINDELHHAKGIDPKRVYVAFANIVLPKNSPKAVFLGTHGYTECRAAMHWSPARPLAEWAVKAQQVDDLRSRLEKRRKAGADPLAIASVEMALALQSDDAEEIAKLKQVFLRAIAKQEDKAVAAVALVAVSSALEDGKKRPAFPDLLDAALDRFGGSDLPKFLYDVLRDEVPAALASGDLIRATRLMSDYRTLFKEAYPDRDPVDSFRFESDNRLWAEAITATEKGNLPVATAILKYFATCPADSPRYRDIVPLATPLQTKLAALDEAKRKELLGDLNLAKALAANAEAAKRVAADRGARPELEPEFVEAKEADKKLPAIPEGKTVYEADFEETVGPEWSVRRRGRSMKTNRVFLGEFGDEPLILSLSELPEHRLLRIRFELITMNGWDGNKGDYANFGPDLWSLSLAGGPRLIYATFSCFRNDPWDSKQTYPDDFPFERSTLMPGVGRADLTAPVEQPYLEERTDLPNHTGHTAAKEHKTLGFDRSSVYEVDVVVPHQDKSAVLRFDPDLRDGCYRGGHMIPYVGESWALDNVRVEAIPDFSTLDPKQIKACIDVLTGSNPIEANAALWRLVSAGEAAIEPLRKEFKPDDMTSIEQQRIRRALRILGAEKPPKLSPNK